MDCENCGSKPAKIHMTEIVNENEKIERHLCEDCAEKLGYTVKQHFSISELLAGLASGGGGSGKEDVPDVKCPSCGVTFAEFQAAGRFGCSGDYDVFKEHVLPRLERYHDASQHVGKAPKGADRSMQRAAKVRLLRARLREAVSQEDYEGAAAIRDEIRELEG
jgi:protein arginine kinase activator